MGNAHPILISHNKVLSFLPVVPQIFYTQSIIMMFLFRSTKSFSTIATTLGLISVSNLILINSANAFSVTLQNGSFENSIVGNNPTAGWNTYGDVTTIGAIDGINPKDPVRQAILTTGYIDGTYNVDGEDIDRRDDNGFNFNQTSQNAGETDTNPVSADTNPNTDILQESLGLGTNAFSIDRSTPELNTLYGPRTSKEGSGMYQQFNVTIGPNDDSFTVNFDWAYLTNDGTTDFGEQDFAFWSLGLVDGTDYTTVFDSTGNPGDEIIVLNSSSSDGAIGSPQGSNDYVQGVDYGPNNTVSYTVSGLSEGFYIYRLGYGVVDVDGLDRTTALLIDNIEVVPFEFTPSTGIGLVMGLIGINKLRRKLRK